MSALRRTLGAVEAFGFSMSMIAPTMAMAFGTTLMAQAAGRSVPLAFLLGAVAVAFVGLSFVAFGGRVAHAGSAYAYVAQAFGPRAGFVAGWALLLAYVVLMTAVTALTGNFVAIGLAHVGIEVPGLWLVVGAAVSVAATSFAWNDMRVAGRLMLLLEAISVAAILGLSIVIVTRAPLSALPLAPDAEHGWSGVGYGIVFAVLSFAGFEGAATLGEEAHNPKRAIPLAVMATIAVTGLFFVFVSYAQVVGFGLDQVQALAQSEAPLDDLSTKFISGGFAVFFDFAAAISGLACVIGGLSACARLLYALGRAGLSPGLGKAHPRHGTPSRAILAVGALNLVFLIVLAGPVGVVAYAGDAAALGTLTLILVYMSVTGGEMVDALRNGRVVGSIVGFLGTMLLLWPLWNSVYPVPDWPGNLWPYLIAAWLAAGLLLVRVLPSLAETDIAASEAAE
ncbi:MAG TPA: APC family permease [Aliidongia sp.]|nr:APC family permease [Aliidongia sp.]